MIIRRKVSKSWHDPEGSRIMSHILRSRLRERTKGRRWKRIDLTYRRDPYAHPRDLYYAARERQDVGRFMQRLGQALGGSLRGKWLCKMEFQQDGWIHWHILVEHGPKIDHDLIARLWGHGYVWVTHGTRRKIDYIAKYVAKAGEGIPGWLLGEPSRSVRMIRVSPGFWDEGRQRERPRRTFRVSAYESLGDRATRLPQERTLINCGKWFISLALAFETAVRILDEAGFVQRPDARGFHVVQGSVSAAVARLKAAAAPGARGGSPFHLTGTPEVTAPPRWLLEFWESMGELEWQAA